jgi:hypothetical protein
MIESFQRFGAGQSITAALGEVVPKSATDGRLSAFDRGCVKTPAPFHADLFCSLFRVLRTFRIKKTAKNFALLGQPQKFAAFSHSLDPKHAFEMDPMKGRKRRESGRRRYG